MDDLKQKVLELESRVEKLEKQLADKPLEISFSKNREEKILINEFLKTKKLEDDVKRTLAIVYWLDKFGGTEFVNTSDIEENFRAARLVVPKNINDKVNMNIRNGYLADNKEKKDGKKAWYITSTGIDFIDSL